MVRNSPSLAARTLVLFLSLMLFIGAILGIATIGFGFAFAYGTLGMGILAGLMIGIAGLIAGWVRLGRRFR